MHGFGHPLTQSGLTGINAATAVVAGQSQRIYSGVGIWYYLSSTPRELRAQAGGAQLE
jgi:hypothetical protein